MRFSYQVSETSHCNHTVNDSADQGVNFIELAEKENAATKSSGAAPSVIDLY